MTQSKKKKTADEPTPLMRQYLEQKNKAEDALLFFRMGDFYELFNEDAVTASRVLEITLTTRDKNKPKPVPMAGVPHHAVQGYVQKLLDSGYKVAICDQVEGQFDPNAKPGKAIVKREIVRFLTPAVQFDQEGSDTNYLATAVPAQKGWILAMIEPSTGETRLSSPLENAQLFHELGEQPIKHFLNYADTLPMEAIEALGETLVERLPGNYLSEERGEKVLQENYNLQQLDPFITEKGEALALGIAVTYLVKSQKLERLDHLKLPVPLHQPRTMTLGPRTAKHLDLLPSRDGTPNLFDLINKTGSALGARQLRRFLLAPLKEGNEIQARQEGVRALAANLSICEEGHRLLREIYDLERISGRISTGLANPRDTYALAKSLSTLEKAASLIQEAPGSLLQDLKARLLEANSQLRDLFTEILANQKEEAPLLARDGGIFKKGVNPDLDRLLDLTENGEKFLIDLEAREREATGIPKLRVKFNRVFGYFIEVSQAHADKVPDHYQRKQTMVGAERFFTEELKKFEDEIVTASTRQKALEQKLFDELIERVRHQTRPLMEAAQSLAEFDAMISMARLADQPGWCFPSIDNSLELQIEGGRHPLVDATTGGAFVPNHLNLSPQTRRTLIITGPNMGGKSTVMRQVALILILGQMGAPVPAANAHWGAISSLFTRIGAHDAIARGQSTFMVEMSELAHILHHANERSFILLDEIGRGTSTYDGISVAWSTLEWIAKKIQARTLFATHYHELTRLVDTLPAIANAHMAVEGKRKKLRFLYELQEGPANESFGVDVAQLAGLPAPVIQRSRAVLKQLESQNQLQGADDGMENQLSFFAAPAEDLDWDDEPAEELAPHPVIEELGGLDLNELTPVQALNTLLKFQETLRESDGASA